LLKLLLCFEKIDHNIGFWEKRQFFRRKLAKIAENCDHNIDPRWVCEKVAQNVCSPTIFLSKLIHDFHRGTMKPSNLRYFCHFQVTVQSKQSPDRQKFAQPGTDVMIWKYFRHKIFVKSGVFCSKYC
jgi:hypothetical protein